MVFAIINLLKHNNLLKGIAMKAAQGFMVASSFMGSGSLGKYTLAMLLEKIAFVEPETPEAEPGAFAETPSFTCNVRLTLDDNGDFHDFEVADEVGDISGGNTVVQYGLTTFDARVVAGKEHVTFNIFDRNDENQFITNGTFAESFRARADYYKLIKDELYEKLSKYHGVGGGTVDINIKTQEVVDIWVSSGSTLEHHECGMIVAADDDIITLTCTFANAGANLGRLVA
tara:strand:- start:4185 stop:4871 length:687 start_codon:yes stop_codon:yes gene_type:complete